jgi:hypothetical protein
MFDVLFFYYYELPRFISRKENIHMPFVGTANPPTHPPIECYSLRTWWTECSASTCQL